MIYGRMDDAVFGRGVARGGFARFAPRVHPSRRPPHPAASSSSSSSSGGWGYPVAVTDGGSPGGGVDIEAIADQVVADLMRGSAPAGPVSFGAEEDGEPQFGAVVPTAALPNSAQNRLAQARYVERMRRDVRDRSAYLKAMDNPEFVETIFDPNPTIIEQETVSVAEEPRYGARYGFSCSVPGKGERMGALDVQTDVTRPSRVPPEFFGGVPAPMVPSHAGYGGVPAPMVPSHAGYGGVPAPMVPSHRYGALPSPMVPSHYGEDSVRPEASPFMDALKIGLGVSLGVTAVVVGVNLVGRAMR